MVFAELQNIELDAAKKFLGVDDLSPNGARQPAYTAAPRPPPTIMRPTPSREASRVTAAVAKRRYRDVTKSVTRWGGSAAVLDGLLRKPLACSELVRTFAQR